MRKIYMILVTIAVLSMTACRGEADHLLSYGQNDALAFSAAENSFAEKYKIFWESMNCNYAIWDYEAAFGVDWDAEYDKFMPRFKELDERSDDNPVTDEELRALMEEMVKPLHDGHLYIQMKNHKTDNFIGVMPSRLRNKDREDYRGNYSFTPCPEWYMDELLDYKGCSTGLGSFYFAVDTTAVLARIQELQGKNDATDLDGFMLSELQSFMDDYRQVAKLFSIEEMVSAFNLLSVRYGKYDIPGLSLFPPESVDYGITLKYALFPGNIAYFYIDKFMLTPWLEESVESTVAPDVAQQMSEQVLAVWKSWFKTVQQLHKEGKLGGVIVDVRGNGGGMVNDYQYVMGSLLPQGNYQIGQARFKNGVGRLDYSVLMPQVMPTLNVDREEITEPVVVLADCNTVSMGEATSLTAKLMDNGRLIGTQTWGGFCYLNTDPAYYSLSYSGCVGVQDETPVFCYIPLMAFMPGDGGILEGVGLTPDIQIVLDRQMALQQRDSQLERALQFIRTGS